MEIKNLMSNEEINRRLEKLVSQIEESQKFPNNYSLLQINNNTRMISKISMDLIEALLCEREILIREINSKPKLIME